MVVICHGNAHIVHVALYPCLELEPERLAEERRCVLGSTQRLAFNNYQTFIETAHCSRAVFTDVGVGGQGGGGGGTLLFEFDSPS